MKTSGCIVAAFVTLSMMVGPAAAQPLLTVEAPPSGGPFCEAAFIGIQPCSEVLPSVISDGTTEIAVPVQALRIAERALSTAVISSNDARVEALGGIERIVFSRAEVSQGLMVINARVIHKNGRSDWQLGILPSGGIATQQLAAVETTAHAPDLAYKRFDKIFDDNSKIYNKLDSLTGLDNSHAPSPFELAAAAKQTSNSSKIPSSRDALPPPIVDKRVVEFLIATTRKPEAKADAKMYSYSGERAALSYAIASVRIPEDHKIGHIELPSSWSLFGILRSPNDREHFIIRRVIPVSDAAFGDIVKSSNSRSALIFVHGFNTSFEDAVMRNAQIVWDLQYKGVSVLFSWASAGSVFNYTYDKDSATIARSDFMTLLNKLRHELGIEEINIIAHSMGNLLTLDALAGHAQTSNPVEIARLIMAAPDVDRDMFVQLAPRAKDIVGGMTLYASSSDMAMKISRQIAGGIPRAGDVPDTGPVLVPEVETIDVTAVGDELLGLNHNMFASSRDVMEDIAAMLRSKQPPPRLTQIRAVPEPPEPVQYWRYVR